MRSDLAPGIFTVTDFLPPGECLYHIQQSEAAGFEAATITSSGGAIRDVSVRNNDRIVFDDEELAANLWDRLRPDVPAFMNGRQVRGLNERWRLYRYQPGQQFAGHVDAPYRRDNGEESILTLLVYLNDDFAGGETAFDDVQVIPTQGMALLFRHELFHAGSPVREGLKYVLRSDVMFGPVGQIRG